MRKAACFRPVPVAIGPLLALLLAGCAGLQPHIFSERLQVQRGADGRWEAPAVEPGITLDEAYADARFVQRRYVSALQEQAHAVPQVSAALIGLSALTLFKGITSPNSRDIAGAGVLGATAWAYGSTLVPATRLDVYRAGAEAMGCALAAVEPLRAGRSSLGTAGDEATKPTLYGARRGVDAAQQALRQTLSEKAALRHAAAPQPTFRTELRRPPCSIPATASAAERVALQQACALQPAQPVRVALPATTRTPPPELLAAFSAAERELAAAQASLRRADEAIQAVDAAGPALWHQSVRIQLAVSAEIEKTVPDLGSVLRAVGAMRDVSFALGGSPKIRDANAQGSERAGAAPKPEARQMTDADRAAADALSGSTTKLANARLALEALVRPLAGVSDRATRELLNACSVRSSGVALRVSPAGDEVTVAAGESAVFFVAGGSGVPSAQVVAGADAPVKLTLEGGQFRFEYKAPANAAEGQVAVLRFSDGAGTAHHLTQVRIGPAPGDKAPADAPAAAPPEKADTSPIKK